MSSGTDMVETIERIYNIKINSIEYYDNKSNMLVEIRTTDYESDE